MEVVIISGHCSNHVILNTKEGRKCGVSRNVVIKLTDEELEFLRMTKGTPQHMKHLLAEQIFDEIIEELDK